MLEYVVVLGVVVVILFSMTPMLKRGIQSLVKVTADQIGVQENADQDFESNSYLVSSNIFAYSITKKDKRDDAGTITYTYPGDESSVNTEELTNLGFSER